MNNIQFDQDLYKRLAPREIEAARAAANGLSTKETASVMGISFNTAKAYRSRLMEKIGCTNMTAVVVSLKDAGIL
jgi:DNA-binding NarL/FixJ family response regulator